VGDEDRRFETIVRDLEINERDYEYEMSQTTPPARGYVIMFMARSGSSWLTSLLSGTEALGYPEEYINPNFVREVARSLNSREQNGFLKLLERRRKTENGIFGIEVRAFDVYQFGPDVFFRHFGYETLFFNLWRENLLLQAISLYRAMESGRWHSYEAPASLPPYNADKIESMALQLLREENDNVRMLRDYSRRARPLLYETMVNDRVGTLRLFADALGVELEARHYAQPARGEHVKIGDEWNEEAERRFRTERPAFLTWLAGQRELKK
jgi:LPS sulfotransferase NodH